MDSGLYQVVLTGELVAGFGREVVLGSLAHLLQDSAARLGRALDAGDCAIDDLLTADEAAALQKRLEHLGARARVERVAGDQAARPRTGLHLPRRDDPVEAGLMRCPACGHQQLVARQCDECGVVFAEFNRQRGAAAAPPRAAPGPSAAPRPAPPSQRSARPPADAGWREAWVDDELPTEQYHIKLFMGWQTPGLAEACQRMMLGRRTRLTPTWAGGAVISPFLWAMHRKMWAWGLVIFITEILVPVVLITAGVKRGEWDLLTQVGLGLLVANRIVWPALLKGLYCRHARRTIEYMNRLAPTVASDIEVAARGGTSRTSAFVGVVLAVVVSLLAWSAVDAFYSKWVKPRQVFGPTPGLPEPTAQEKKRDEAMAAAQNELLDTENKWVATRNRLRVLGQQINAWLLGDGSAQDPAALDLKAIAGLTALDAESLRDGWDRDIRYESDGKGFRLVSAGPDGEFGSTDDVEYRRLLER